MPHAAFHPPTNAQPCDPVGAEKLKGQAVPEYVGVEVGVGVAVEDTVVVDDTTPVGVAVIGVGVATCAVGVVDTAVGSVGVATPVGVTLDGTGTLVKVAGTVGTAGRAVGVAALELSPPLPHPARDPDRLQARASRATNSSRLDIFVSNWVDNPGTRTSPNVPSRLRDAVVASRHHCSATVGPSAQPKVPVGRSEVI